MKSRFFKIIVAGIFTLGFAQNTSAQTYIKLNGLYALAGVINPAAEFVLSPHSTFQSEIVFSPWKQIGEKHALFGIFMNEYRYFFKKHNTGWYLGANAGMMGFNFSKPYLDGFSIKFQNRYSKGYGIMLGVCAGFEYQFAERWVLDAFLGWSWMHSYYNGYSMDGQIDMNPHRPIPPKYPDPFNASAEWYPNKIGISIGYRIFNPKK